MQIETQLRHQHEDFLPEMICSNEASQMVAGSIHSDALFVAVYAELKQLAFNRLSRLPAGQTLHATVLVHEAYMKIVQCGLKTGNSSWANQDHFIAAASEAMRCILIDHYRRRQCQKRGQ